jgi:hypothetical protein
MPVAAWRLPVGLSAGQHVEDLQHVRLVVYREADAPPSQP